MPVQMVGPEPPDDVNISNGESLGLAIDIALNPINREGSLL